MLLFPTKILRHLIKKKLINLLKAKLSTYSTFETKDLRHRRVHHKIHIFGLVNIYKILFGLKESRIQVKVLNGIVSVTSFMPSELNYIDMRCFPYHVISPRITSICSSNYRLRIWSLLNLHI